MGEDKKILFGKYELGSLLGKGTFAKVYQAKHLATNECVAIKVIKKDEVIKNERMMEQILREISVMRLVRHPNIVELKEVMATKSKIFFVMEYVRGAAAFSTEKSSPRRKDLKISDFGLSALHEHPSNGELLHTQCGTPAYVAPEVLQTKGYNGAKADIWSCGVILYVLLAGFLPFQDENLAVMYRKIYKAEYEFPPWFSTETKRLVSKLLVADPAKRLSIPGIMRVSWFRKGFTRPNAFSMEESIFEKFDEEEKFMHETIKKSPSSPAFLNAFEFISSMSTGFDLSNMFEDGRKAGSSKFTSRCSAKVIMGKIEVVGKRFGFKAARMKDFKLRLVGPTEGRKGRLSVTAEVFKVAPEMTVVELSKFSGDTLEYIKFREEDIRPALKDIVWTWQGENNGFDDRVGLQESRML
ncbi:UNVERIFIED_CONTAM: CBL-interacting serine/threonine-protein kinase [Sesamum calycinum]|uniref:non-specific serine/threonine protein kinase n=1 Tax=Sesamum calycinum TaxID=2727403 RepID=A0AAW2LXM3_9LAMI